MAGSQPSPVASTSGCDVGTLDTQVLEKLQETFFYRQFDFCAHKCPTFLCSEYHENRVIHRHDAVL
jgi:hypothetical protein